MRDCVQILLFIEPASSSDSKNKGRNARSSTAKYALFLNYFSKAENHPIFKILTQNGIQIIQNDQIALPRSLKFEVIELLIKDVIPVERRVYLHPFNNDYVQQLLSKSSADFKNSDGFLECNNRKFSNRNEHDLKVFEKLLSSKVDLSVREGGTLLHLVANKSHLTYLLKLFLEHGAKVDATKEDGATALHVATSVLRHHECNRIRRCYQGENIEVLLDNRASLSAKRADGATPLHLVSKLGCLHTVKVFLERGANVNAVAKDGSTPLYKAAEGQHLNVMECLLGKGAKVNAKTKDGTTPLHIAAKLCAESHLIVELLLQNGAKVNEKDAEGATALFYSAKKFYRITQLLVQNGADINIENNRGETALLVAGSLEIFSYILSLNPDVSSSGNRKAFIKALCNQGKGYEFTDKMLEQGFGIAPEDASIPEVLFGAIHKGYVDIAQRLLQYGANVNQYATFFSHKMAPLHFAIQHNQKSIVKLLLDHGADVNAKRSRPVWTPIMDAVACAGIEIVKLLVAKGVKVRDKPTLLHLAAENKRPEVTEYLLEEGLDLNGKNSRDDTPLSIAIEKRNVQVVEVLVKFGARIELNDLTGKAILEPILRFWFTHPSTSEETLLREFFAGILHEIPNDEVNKNGWVLLLAKHLVKLGTVNQVSYIPAQFCETFGLSDFQTQCELEAESMKLENVGCTGVTFYEVLTKSYGQIACCARNKSFIKALDACEVEKKYPIYGSILSNKIRFGCHRRRLLDQGIKILNLSPQLRALPHDVKEIITDFLNNQDLTVLQKCLILKKHSK